MAQHTTFFWTFAFAAVTVYVVISFVRSTYGSGFLAVRDDEIAAEAMGISHDEIQSARLCHWRVFRRGRWRPLRALQAVYSSRRLSISCDLLTLSLW